MEELFRIVLSNYREIAMYDRALSEIICAINGAPIYTISYTDERLAIILCTIKNLQQELKDLHEKLNETDRAKNNGSPSK